MMSELQKYSEYDISQLAGEHKLIAASFRVAREMKGDYANALLDEIKNHKKTKLGYSRLHLAVFENDALVKQILDEGADVNAINNEGETPLFLAVYENNTQIAKMLIENGANIDMVDPSLLDQAIFNKNMEIIQILLNHNIDVNPQRTGPSPLYHAVTLPHLGIPQLLLESGADADKGDEMNTPLTAVIDRGDMEFDLVESLLVKLILKHGADVNKKGGFWGDETPLHIAVGKRKTEIIRILLENGADTNVKNRDFLTPLALAEQKGYSAGVELLRSFDESLHTSTNGALISN